MARIRSHNSIYSISLISLHKTWDTPIYIRNFSYHEIILVNFPDHPIKIKWYDLNIISYRGMVSTPYILDHITPFRPVTIYRRNILYIDSSYYSSHHSARLSPSLSLSLRSAIAIAIIITPLGHRHRYYYHSARPSPSLSLSLRSVIAIAIIITPLGYRHPHYYQSARPSLSPSSSLRSAIPIIITPLRYRYYYF